MKGYKVFKALKIVVCVVIFAAVAGFIVMHLWNLVVPSVMGFKAITFEQALILFVLCKILFGGFHRHGGGRGGKRGMRARWESMTPEEREKVRAGMRGRRGWCRPEMPEEQSAV
jgi:hypothetical protein